MTPEQARRVLETAAGNPLALLELFKAGAVELSQGDRFGDIHATWTGTADEHDVMSDIDEYALEPEV